MTVHSVLVRVEPVPCATAVRQAAPWLRPYVVGYGGFRTRIDGQVQRRMLPLNLVTLIVDVEAPVRLMTGPRGTPLAGDTPWRHGVTIGLTPAGMAALTGMPMRAVAGETADLRAVLGARGDELAERVAEAPTWSKRFTLLDDLLTAWLRPERAADGAVDRAWWHLQETGGRIPIDRLAETMSIGRRGLESGFRREIGLTPKTVARIARFQRATAVLCTPAPLTRAVDCGYADQPHLTREVRAMAGVTPSGLRAFLQYHEPLRD